MSYSVAQTEPLAQRLVSNLPGFDISLARSWITLESGANNNPLGVTARLGSGQPVGQMIGSSTYLVKYPTPQAGIDAASKLLTDPSMSWAYGGVTQAITSGDRTAQAKALIASPWNTPNSPYYTRGFTRAGLLGAGAALAAVPVKPDPPGPASRPNGSAVQGTMSWLLGLGAGAPGSTPGSTSGNKPLTQAMIDSLSGDIPVDNPNRDAIIAGLQSQIGKPVNTVKVPSNWTDTPTGGWQNFWGGQAGKNGSGGGVGNSGIGSPSTNIFGLKPVALLYLFGGTLMVIAGGWIMIRNTGSVTTIARAIPA